jgi:hypothetical protein
MLRHPEHASPEDALASLQDASQRVQLCLARFEGQIYEIAAEEEGITFIAVFGLPPGSQEDNTLLKLLLGLHPPTSGTIDPPRGITYKFVEETCSATQEYSTRTHDDLDSRQTMVPMFTE